MNMEKAGRWILTGIVMVAALYMTASYGRTIIINVIGNQNGTGVSAFYWINLAVGILSVISIVPVAVLRIKPTIQWIILTLIFLIDLAMMGLHLYLFFKSFPILG